LNEEPSDALVRELSEELGIVPVAPKAVFVVAEPRPEAHGHGEFHVFLVTDWIGEPVLKNAEHDQLGWFTLAEAAGLDLADKAILDVLGHVLNGLPT
jgi:8-oxo-dGTP pyrophosphatase MutT (NUDIX family)